MIKRNQKQVKKTDIKLVDHSSTSYSLLLDEVKKLLLQQRTLDSDIKFLKIKQESENAEYELMNQCKYA